MMEIIYDATKIENKLCELIEKFENISIAVAWASTKSQAYQQLIKHRDHIKFSTVGLHFYQTAPDFINEFLDDANIRFYTKNLNEGIFHPKIYLFWNNENDWVCLNGSANFTLSALTKNSEIMTLFTQDDGIEFQEIKNIFEYYYNKAKVMSQKDLKNYIDEREKNKKETEDDFQHNNEMKSILDMTWDEYYKYMLENVNEQVLDERLELLDKAEQIFLKPLEKISDLTLSHIAGVKIRDEEDEIYWEYFGTMNRTGLSNPKIVRKIFNEMNKYLISPKIQKNEFLSFASEVDKIKRISLTSMSRLLAMRYPDKFYCITSANERGLLNEFQISKGIKQDTSKKYERYWNEIIEPIQNSSWYDSKPTQEEQELKVWKARVILLDAVFYGK